MANKPRLGIFDRTEPEPAAPPDNSDLDEGRIISSGVGITEGELTAVDALAKEYNATRNSLLHIAVRLFIEGVRAGTIDPNTYLQEPDEPPKRRYRRKK